MTLSKRPIAALLALAVLAGCSGLSQSRVNPMNWFGPRKAAVIEFSIEKPTDPRALIDMIVTAAIERTPSGALVRATGRAATQGYWLADLVVGGMDEAGNLIIDFRAVPAGEGTATATATATPRSREITAAVSLRADTLASAKRITVRGAQNSKTLRP